MPCKFPGDVPFPSSSLFRVRPAPCAYPGEERKAHRAPNQMTCPPGMRKTGHDARCLPNKIFSIPMSSFAYCPALLDVLAYSLAQDDLSWHRPTPHLPVLTHPHRYIAMAWREGTATERTQQLVGQKIKVWWEDDEGNVKQPGRCLPARRNLMTAMSHKYVPTRTCI